MTTETKNVQRILFTRVWRSLEQAAVLSVRTQHDAGTAFAQLCHAVNQWVARTKEGRKLASYSNQDLNIGDLLSHDAFQDTDLLTLMKAAGVEYVDCYGLSDVQCQDYDRVLMDRMPEIDEDSVPVVTESDAAPTRLTGAFGQWVEDAKCYRNGADIMPFLTFVYPELPATEPLRDGDPRDHFVGAYLDLCYLAAYRNEQLGIMLELPVGHAKDISADDFAGLVSEQRAKLQRLQHQYPPFAFSVAYGEATSDGQLFLRAFVPLDTDHHLTACDRALLQAVQDDLLLGALAAPQPTQDIPF